MVDTPANNKHQDNLLHDRFPILRRLGICQSELRILARQGYVEQRRRKRGEGGYWRLRFRIAGKTKTIYIGCDDTVVARVQDELKLLQAHERHRRELCRAVAAARRVMRQMKARLDPFLAEIGYHYHGMTVRKRRVGVEREIP